MPRTAIRLSPDPSATAMLACSRSPRGDPKTASSSSCVSVDTCSGRFVLVPERLTCGVALPASARADALAFADQVGEALGRSRIAFDRRALAERGMLP